MSSMVAYKTEAYSSSSLELACKLGKSATVNFVDSEGPLNQNDWTICKDICRSAIYTATSNVSKISQFQEANRSQIQAKTFSI